MIEYDSSSPRRPDLANFFWDCGKCGYVHRFDYYDQVIICRCGRINRLPIAFQTRLRKEREEMRALIASNIEQSDGEKE